MRLRPSLITIVLLISFCAVVAPAERIKFQRKKFDRSRFDRAGPTAQPAPAVAEEPVEEPRAEPTGEKEFPFSDESTTSTSTNTAIFSADAPPMRGKPPPTYFKGATAEQIAVINEPLFDEIPSKWFKNARRYEEAAELQKTTGGCLILYFENPTIPNQKGLGNWFEKSVTTDIKWRKAMKYFIKLKVSLPGNSAARDLKEQYRVLHCPSLIVVQPGMNRGTRINLFDFAPNSRPEPLETEEILTAIRKACTPAYETLF